MRCFKRLRLGCVSPMKTYTQPTGQAFSFKCCWNVINPSHIPFFSCTFHSVGTAAGEQKFNSLCVLSLNIINEKIYLLLWFWFYLLTLLTGCQVLYRILVIVLPFSR